MPIVAKDKRDFYRAKITSLIAQDHQMTLEELSRRLEIEYGIKLERHFLSGLVKKFYAERARRADRYTLNAALAAFQDTMTQVVRVAWSIANDPFAKNQDRVMALREIREANNVVFDKLFDAGVFERKLGTIDAAVRNTAIPQERSIAIREVLINWVLPPMKKEDAKPSDTTPGT